MSNPFFKEFKTPFNTFPFDEIKEEHFLQAMKEGIKRHKDEISAIKSRAAEDFSTIEDLDRAGSLLSDVQSVFYNLNSSNSNDNMREIATVASPLMTGHANDISLDQELFTLIKKIYDKKDDLNLNSEKKILLDKTYKSFSRNGALLDKDDKEKFREISKELSQLSLDFQNNLMKDSQAYLKLIEDKDDLAGLPDSYIEAASMTAKEKGHEGKWAITLDFPSFGPFLQYAEKRELRKEVFEAYGNRANKNDDNDNKNIVLKIVKLRHQRANLLGYKTHADFVLEERMASNTDNVFNLLNELRDKAMPLAREHMAEIESFAKETDGIDELRQWDYSYYFEKLKKQRFNIDQEELKPYFKLENVLDGVFKMAEKLFGLKFVVREDIPKYHEDVVTYEVLDEGGNHVAIFYGDYFPREGKRSGAWMTSFRDQYTLDGKDYRPHIANVCNFTKPTNSKPSLLNFNEVLTLFHEFGHGLHGMLSKCNYESISGTSVYWDFVELPSQILENWAYEKECLDLFAKHFETDEKIPEELVQKIKESSNFGEARATIRQLTFGILDMGWHSIDPTGIDDVSIYEKSLKDEMELFKTSTEGLNSTSFGHIFSGGYSAGYYSYKWAEVLDADAFAYFQEKGIFNKDVATSFKENILEKGGSEHPMELYKKFRGSEPSVDPLLKRGGLL